MQIQSTVGYSLPPPAAPRAFDLRATLSLLRRQIRLIGAATALAVALAVVYLVLVNPVFTATALVLFDPNTKSLVFADAAALSGTAENARIESEVEILRAPAVALAVLRDQRLIQDAEFGPRLGLGAKLAQALGFAPADPGDGSAELQTVLERFQRATEVRRRGLTYVIAVSVHSRSAERAATLANAMSAAYIAAQIEGKVAASLAARDILQTQADSARAGLAQSEGRIDEFISRNLAAIEAESGRADIAVLRRTLEEADAQRQAASTLATASRRLVEAPDWAALADSLQDAALAELQRQRTTLERQIAGAPAAGSDAAGLRAELAALEQRQQAQAGAAIARLEQQAATHERTAQEMRGQIRQTLLSGEIPVQVLSALFGLQQEATIARDQYQLLLSRMRELEVQAAVQMADSRVVSPALAPNHPSYPNAPLLLALALLAGAGIGVGLAFLNEYYIGGITSESQLHEVLQAPVASAIPLLPEAQRAGQPVADAILHHPLGSYAEAVRRLRATLELSERRRARHGGGSVILLTSTVSAEGKSTTALALARAFVQAGRRVLLIDADLRKPALHQLLAVTPALGLGAWLAGPAGTATDALIIADPQCPLAVVPGAGRALAQTDHLLGGAAFETLLRDARGQYDTIIIDSPPLLPVVDGRYLAAHADAAVLLVRFAQVAQGDIRSAIATLREALRPGADLVTVLSHLPAGSSGYGYAGYYDQPA